MAAGDLILGQGTFTGPASGITIASPGVGNTHVITTDDETSYVAAMELGGQRIKLASGVNITQTEQHNPEALTQIYCPDGSVAGAPTITGRNFDGAIGWHFQPQDDDQFFGNIIFKPGVGHEGQGNNSVACISFDDTAYDTKGVYFFMVGGDTDPAVASMSGDSPEMINCFNGTNSGDITRYITMHGFYIPTHVFDSKHFTGSAGGSNTTVNTLILFLRGYSFAWKRSPRGNDGMSIDIVNLVQPDHESDGVSSGIVPTSAVSNTRVDVRGCSIFNNTTTFGDISMTNSNILAYYVTDGSGDQVVDDSVELKTPDINWGGTNPQSTSQVGTYAAGTKPTPEAMDGTLRTLILSETATSYTISEDTPPDTLDPITAGHSAWNTLHNALPGVFHIKMEPYEDRFRQSLYEPFFYRWNNAAKALVKEWNADWPGLQPEVSRGRMWLPTLQQFSLGGI